mgnify:CR=1 FL=1
MWFSSCKFCVRAACFPWAPSGWEEGNAASVSEAAELRKLLLFQWLCVDLFELQRIAAPTFTLIGGGKGLSLLINNTLHRLLIFFAHKCIAMGKHREFPPSLKFSDPNSF